jgi:ankyrin repeat protein
MYEAYDLKKAAKNGDASEVAAKLARIKAEFDPDRQSAFINKKDLDGHYATPLYYAVMGGHYKVVELLLEAKAKVDCREDELKYTPLHYAAMHGDEEVVQLLLEANATPDLQDTLGQTALHNAAKNGHEEVVELLLEANATPNLQDKLGYTALYYAAMHDYDFLIKPQFEVFSWVSPR